MQSGCVLMDCERRVWKHHSRIKLRLLRRYLTMSSTVNETFQYFETHAGEGKLLFDDGCEEDGSTLIACTHKNKFPCVVMEKEAENITKLKKLLPKKEYPNVTILKGDSNIEIQRILSKIKKYHFSLGFIDPDSPKQLKWKTIEKIALHSYKRKSDGFLRRPEMIINFPIEGIKRNAGFLKKVGIHQGAETYCKINDEFFGTNDWKNLWNEYENDNILSREKLLELYIKNLKIFYNYVIPLIFVESINNLPLYHIISCTQHSLGEKFLNTVKNDVKKWQKEDWVRDYYKVHSIHDFISADVSQPTLNDFN
jgi:three-Cys-motif partner protein